MRRRAPGDRFRRESPIESFARSWPSSAVPRPVRRALKPLFEKVIGWRTGGAVESRLPHGEIVRLMPAWRHVSWNRQEYAAFREAIHPGDVVIDAGANAGAYAVLFGQWVGPTGRVYAFEPDPRVFAALEEHIALNGLADRVVPISAAVAENAGRAEFHLAVSAGLSRMGNAAAGAHAGAIDVTALSIDGFTARDGIHPAVIKIDVEGAELAALRGARRTIARAGSRMRLFVEMHPALWPELGITADDVLRECHALGLTLETLDGSRERLWDVEGVCLRLRPAGGDA